MTHWNVLELFSGIGGMHTALEISGTKFRIVGAVDINEAANAVYQLNHPETPVWNRNIQSLTTAELEKLEINTILMSPPCQPFTRQGKKLDIEDNRSQGFLAICSSIIRQLSSLQRILMENVKGFEESEAHEQFVAVLKAAGFHFQEYLLNPIDCLGMPNSRTRYFCIARKGESFPSTINCPEIRTSILPEGTEKSFRKVQDIIEEDTGEGFLIPKKDLMKNCWVYDMVTPDSTCTNCFTKSYGHFARGTGSVFCPFDQEKIREVFEGLRANEKMPENERLVRLKELQLRYFSPREIEKLMGFPEPLKYPDFMTNRQKYKLLGNSLNVQVVAELLKIL